MEARTLTGVYVSRFYHATKTHLGTGQPFNTSPIIEAWVEENALESFPFIFLATFYIQFYPTLFCSHVNCANIADLRGHFPAGVLPISDNVDPPFLDAYVQAIQSHDSYCSAWPLSREGWFGAPNEFVDRLPCHPGTSFIHSSMRAIVSGEAYPNCGLRLSALPKTCPSSLW